MALCVFISYQRADEVHAVQLAANLESHGVDVWWDAKIPKGDDWRERIVAALTKADLVVLLHSGASERSEEVRNELAVARAERKPIVATQLENRKPSGAFLYEMARFNWVPAYTETSKRLEDLARQLSQVDPAAPPGAFMAAINARRMAAPVILRLINSNLLLAVVWLGATIGGFACHDMMDEGYSSMATESGLRPADLVYAILAVVLGAPVFLLRFSISPPTTPAEIGMLAFALILSLVYVLLLRNLLRWVGRSLAGALARKKRSAG